KRKPATTTTYGSIESLIVIGLSPKATKKSFCSTKNGAGNCETHSPGSAGTGAKKSVWRRSYVAEKYAVSMSSPCIRSERNRASRTNAGKQMSAARASHWRFVQGVGSSLGTRLPELATTNRPSEASHETT